ncbi:Farnesyl pyrophosphate synthase like protein [Argiope bruennichi]|uniref:Farnesyl pyrophosphate synthase n=1 Tax=Argiope bruennichi TaxID=94029 RepID=A0A8T0E0W5_ARGBR|nr:Farnesyl pyrophosphate synthase like protein [Argiope bruennichi]
MTSNLSGRLHVIVPFVRRVFRENQCLYPLKKRIFSRKFSSAFLNRYQEDKYSELRNRLAAVPYLNLLDKEVDCVHHDLCNENDERLKDALKWFSKVFNYNARSGKKIRAVALLKAYCTYGFNIDDVAWKQWDSDNWRSAVILAWCIELLQAYFIILDDIMDQSVLRRGEPCWYKKPRVGLCAINRDDRLDCFGKSEITGKFGNDIREGKCTWFSVKFLEEAPESMKKIFLENYGVDDKDATAKVFELYRKANLLEKFEEFDAQLCTEISTLIESMNDIKGALFYDLFAQLRNREK